MLMCIGVHRWEMEGLQVAIATSSSPKMSQKAYAEVSNPRPLAKLFKTSGLLSKGNHLLPIAAG